MTAQGFKAARDFLQTHRTDYATAYRDFRWPEAPKFIFTSNNFGGTLSITDSTISGNTGGHWTNVQSGSVTDAGSAVGTNAKSITITNSSVQGL